MSITTVAPSATAPARPEIQFIAATPAVEAFMRRVLAIAMADDLIRENAVLDDDDAVTDALVRCRWSTTMIAVLRADAAARARQFSVERAM